MKRAFTISTILLSIVVIILLTFLVLQNTKAKMDVIVIKSNQYSITGIDDNNDLIVVESMIQDLSGFRQGQTVKVYYGGVITSTWPGRITATKVKLKDDSRIQIADNYLRYAYSNTKNVELDISESTVDEFKFSIVDNNSLKYLYNEDCKFSLSKDGVSLFKKEPFKMETIEEGKLKGSYKYEEKLKPGKYTGNVYGTGDKVYGYFDIEFIVEEDGTVVNSKAKIHHLGENFSGE